MFCPYCGKDKQEQQFYKNPIKSGEYIHRCKACVGELYKDAVSHVKSPDAALWAVCMNLGIPLRRDIYEATMKSINEADRGKRPNPFIVYHTYLMASPDNLTGVWDSNVELSEFIDIGEVATAAKDEVAQQARWRKQWGGDYADEDCQWLDDMFDSYTEEILEMDTAMEMRYRDLCKLELEQYKNGVTKDTQAQIKQLMSLLKLDNFKENKQSDTEKFIDRWAWRLENEEPAEVEDLNKYKDYAGNEKMWADILRTARNSISGSRDYPDILPDKK